MTIDMIALQADVDAAADLVERRGEHALDLRLGELELGLAAVVVERRVDHLLPLVRASQRRGVPLPGPGEQPRPRPGRLVAVDAARGLALVGLTAVHFLPQSYPDNDRPTLSWLLFAGDSAALFALLAGVSLAFSTGGRRPSRGRDLTADRAGLAVPQGGPSAYDGRAGRHTEHLAPLLATLQEIARAHPEGSW